MANAKGLKKLLSGMLTAVMTLSLTVAGGSVSGGMFEPAEVKAASGYWEMTKRESVGPRDILDGWNLQNNGFDSSDDSWSCRLYLTSTYDGSVTDLDLKIDSPSKTYNAGQEIGIGYEYTIRATAANEVPSVDAGFSTDERVMTDDSWGGTIDNVSKFYFSDGEEIDKNNGHADYIWDRGGVNPNFWSKSTVHATLEAGKEDGEKIYLTLGANFGRGNVFPRAAYEYTWRTGTSGKSDDDDATTIGEDSDDEDDIVVGQVQNVKLTNKKVKRIYISYNAVSDAAGYQIQYSTSSSMSGAKKMNATVVKGYFKNAKGKKATFKKGKTYYVQVRAYAKDSDGNKVYGAWSAKKSVKIKK